MKFDRKNGLETLAAVIVAFVVIGLAGAAAGTPATIPSALQTPDQTPRGSGPPSPDETDDPEETVAPTSNSSPSSGTSPTGGTTPTGGATTTGGGGGTPDPEATGPTAAPPPIPKQCEDGVDNDGDGKVDVAADPGCESTVDDDERDVVETFYATTIGIRHDFSPHRFVGRVSSAHFGCVHSRPVVLKKVRSGADRVIARGRATDTGLWTFPHSDGGRGRYYAVARKITFGSEAAPIICLRDRSDTVRTSG